MGAAALAVGVILVMEVLVRSMASNPSLNRTARRRRLRAVRSRPV